jgi:hypothetical protein
VKLRSRGLVDRYHMTAQVLRLLVDGELSVLDGNADALRSVLRTGAEACERFGDIHQQLIEAVRRVAELEDLLARVAVVLGTEPLPVDGGAWSLLTLAQEVRRALGQAGRE